MKSRSPLLGYNHNIRYAGRLYHVQTEDSGLQNPHVFTHLFFGGTILASKRSDYTVEDADNAVQKVMQAQHKAMLKELRAGVFDAKLEKHFGEPVVRDVADVEPADSRRATLPPVDEPAPRAAEPTPLPPPRPAEITPLPIELTEMPVPAGGPPPLPLAVMAPPPVAVIEPLPVAAAIKPAPIPVAVVEPAPIPVAAMAPPIAVAAVAPLQAPVAARAPATEVPPPLPVALIDKPPENIWDDDTPPPLPSDATLPSAPPGMVQESIHDLPTAQLSDLFASPPPPPTVRETPVDRVQPRAFPPPPRTRAREATEPDLRPPSFVPPQRSQPNALRRSSPAPRSQPASPYGNKPSAEGVVVARPAVIVSDVVTSRGSPTPRRTGQVPTAPPAAPREQVVENIFGEDLVSEKSLDEVILAYLADDLPGK